MSVSAIFGARLAGVHVGGMTVPVTGGGRCNSGRLVIVCSSRPQKKATAHHKKTRPRKTQPWDMKRKPTVYAPLPPMPPDWTLVSSAADNAEETAPESAEAPSGSE